MPVSTRNRSFARPRVERFFFYAVRNVSYARIDFFRLCFIAVYCQQSCFHLNSTCAAGERANREGELWKKKRTRIVIFFRNGPCLPIKRGGGGGGGAFATFTKKRRWYAPVSLALSQRSGSRCVVSFRAQGTVVKAQKSKLKFSGVFFYASCLNQSGFSAHFAQCSYAPAQNLTKMLQARSRLQGFSSNHS